MFAVMILGVGAVMVAAMFPAAIRQTQANVEETTASTIARGAVSVVAQSLTEADLPPDPGVIQTIGDLPAHVQQKLKGDLICPADRGYAWVPLLRRDGPEPVAMVWIIVVRSRSFGSYDVSRDVNGVSGSDMPPGLEPLRVSVTSARDESGADAVRLSGAGASAAAEGALLLIANDRQTGELNGQSLRLGNRSDSDDHVWGLSPGSALPPGEAALHRATAFLIGRGYADPAHPEAGHSGPAQDIAVYATFVRLH